MLNEQSMPRGWRLGGQWDISSIMRGYESDYYARGSTVKIGSIAAIDKAGPDDLAFCSGEDRSAISLISRSNAGIILCKKSLQGLVEPKPSSQLVFMNNPRFAFVQFVNRARAANRAVSSGTIISPTARIHVSAQIGSDCFIGEYATVGENCILADNVYVGDRVSLVQNCTVGSGSIFQPGAVLGADGFAYERSKDGKMQRFPHFGGVIVGKNVEISSNCSVARGSLGDTIIGEGTKLDALVHIAHNTIVGRNCQLTAGTIIGGSAKIGDSCWTGLNCTIKDHVRLGNHVLVGSGASVVKDVPDEDVVAGVPAKSIKDKISTRDLFLMVGKSPS